MRTVSFFTACTSGRRQCPRCGDGLNVSASSAGIRLTPCQRRRRTRHRAISDSETNIALDVSATDVAKYETMSRAVAERLKKLQVEAPDDIQRSNLDERALQWNEDELLREGALLNGQDKSSTEHGAPTAHALDPNEVRKRQGRRLVVSEVPLDALPKVAIVGRPNVGKSALFNRVVGKAAAIVYDTPGVTRDRLYMRASWGAREFVLIDTGGLMSAAAALPPDVFDAAVAEVSAADLPFAIERQAAAGIAEADVVIMVCDGQEGPTGADEEVLTWLRKVHSDKRVILAVNKCESATQGDVQAAMFWGFGFEPLPVSAISGSGTGELMEQLVDTPGIIEAIDLSAHEKRQSARRRLASAAHSIATGMQALPAEQEAAAEERETPLAIAVVGRPNVGKSSLINSITGTNRAIVSDMQGTTRDSVDTEVSLPDGTPIRLVDTAGIRRRARVASSTDGAEPLSVVRAIRALRRTDVVVLMLDAAAGVTAQDYRLAELAAAEGRAAVLVVNKWDRAPDQGRASMKDAEANVKEQLRPLSWASTVFTSATEGKNIHKVLKACIDAGAQHARRVPTGTLNLVVNEATMWKAPPAARGSSKKPRIYYATQAAVRPPTFIFFCNDGRLIGDDYKRYLERALRESIDLQGTPIRMFFKGRATTPAK